MKQNGIILVPLDGSEVAEAILPEVETIARAFNATIRVMRAFGGHREDTEIVSSREADEYVRVIRERLKAKRLNVFIPTSSDSDVIYTTNVAKAILDYSKNADLIMMSTHGRSGVGHWLLGSVAEKVVHHATTPVYLVRPIFR